MPSAQSRDQQELPVPSPSAEEEARRYADAILGTTRQPLLVLNAEYRVESANRAFYRVFGTDPAQTLGRPIYDLGNGQWNIAELRDLLEQVLPSNGTVEDFRVAHDFEHIGRRVMLINAHRMPRAGRPDAILLAIDDITEQEHTTWLLEGEKEYARKIIDASRQALLILGWDLRVRAANQAFYARFQTTPADTEGKAVYNLGDGQWNIPALRNLLEGVLPNNDAFDDFEVEHDFGPLGQRIMVLNARRVDHMQLILLSIEDRTEIRRADRALRRNEALLSTILRHAPLGIGLADRQGRWVVSNALLQRLTAGLIPSRDPRQIPLWHPMDGAAPENWPDARALRGEQAIPGTDFRRQVDGQDRWLRVTASPVEGTDPIEHAVVTIEDVTRDRESQEERELLLGELNHRVKNLFGVIRSLVSQGTGGPEVEAYKTTLKGRMDALVRAHSLAIESRWGSIDLKALAERTLQPYAAGGAGAIAIEGETLPLAPRQALSVSLTLHELATNAVKYGALSLPQGRVRFSWHIRRQDTGRRVELAWEESGGPRIRPPAAQGFGTRLVERVFDYDLQGGASMEFRPEGLRVTAWFPLT